MDAEAAARRGPLALPLLAVDTSGPGPSVAVLREDGSAVVASAEGPASSALHGLLAQALREAGLELRDVRRLACVRGPGSFTGLRVGLSTVAGLAMATGTPAVGVATTAATALASGLHGAVVVVLEGGHGRVFMAEHAVEAGHPRTVTEAVDATAEEALAALAVEGAHGAVRGRPPRLAEMLVRARLVDGPLAEAAGRAAAIGACGPLAPLYARAPALRVKA